MALRAPTRRDQRRRLLASRNRAADGVATEQGGPDVVAASASYDDDAHPERHPALATRLPVGGGRFAAVAVGVLVVFAAAIVLAVSGPLLDRPLVPTGGRFARTLAVLAGAFDPRAVLPVQVWLAELALLLAAAVAGSVRLMRRHRRDDYKGRFRAWGWLAALLSLAAWAGAVPLGPLVAAILSDATGIVLGPAGIGWWVGLAAAALLVVTPWALLPLRERAATIAWTTLGLGCWAVAAGMPWAMDWVGGVGRGAVLAQAAWVAGAGLMLIAMLAAARSVIREVRGQSAAPPRRRAVEPRGRVAAAGQPESDDSDATDEATGEQADEGGWGDAEAAEPSAEESDFEDGSDHGNRRLSKAERKRLRKLARMNGYAA